MAALGFSLFFLLLIFFDCSLSKSPLYKLDGSWPKDRSLLTGEIYTVAVDERNSEVYIGQRGTDTHPVVVFTEDGQLKRAFGKNETLIDSIHGSVVHFNDTSNRTELWVTDVGNGTLGHTVKRFSQEGELLGVLGTPGTAGSSLSPLQFDHVAELVFYNDYIYTKRNHMFIVDGDGGLNNRLLSLNKDFQVEWSQGSSRGSGPTQFSVPHSVAMDQFERLWVADRLNNRTQVFAANGTHLASWTSCFNSTQPTAIRLSLDRTHFLVALINQDRVVMVAAPQDPGQPLGADCTVIDSLQLPLSSKPHLLDISRTTGAFYLAQLGQNGLCQKYVPTFTNPLRPRYQVYSNKRGTV